jgi:hypothetical protein
MRSFFLSIAILGFWLLPGTGRSDEPPTDPYLCIVPVPYGETGSTRRVGRHPDPVFFQFIPGYPTPIFFAHGSPGSLYIDPGGHLRLHPRPDTHYFDPYYAGPHGTVFWWDHAGRALFFDRKRGYFRPIVEASADQRVELSALRAALDGKGSAGPVPQKLGRGGVRNLSSRRGSSRATGDHWRVEAPALGIVIEGRADRLRLTKGERSVEHVVPGLSTLSWHLTELPRSGRAVLVSLFESRMLVVDEDLNLTRPAGDWRLPRHPEVLLLPETGEALVTTSNALFWLRDRRISGPDICGNVEPPPSQPIRLIKPQGADEMIQDERDRVGGFWPDARNGTVLLLSERGLFRLGQDNGVRRIEGDRGYRYRGSWRIPGTDQVMVGTGRGFVVVDGNGILFDSGKIERSCCFEAEPILRNPRTGSVLLSDGRYLTRDWQIRELKVPSPNLRLDLWGPAVSSAAWLPGPLIGGFLWDEKDELHLLGIELSPPIDSRMRNRAVQGSPFWLDFARFGFLATIIRGWRKLGPDLKLVPMPGQPEEYVDAIWGGRPQLAFLDPGIGDVLLGLREGLWAVDPAGTMRRVACEAGCAYGYVTSIVGLPGAEGSAIVGAEGGLFRNDPGAGGILRRIAEIDRTGAVFRLHAVPWRKMILIEAALGNFTWTEDAGLRLLGVKADSWFTPRFVVTEAPDRVFVRGVDLTVLEFPED